MWVVSVNGKTVYVYPLREYTIGRTSDCSFVVEDSSVSRKHLKFRVFPPTDDAHLHKSVISSLELTDLNSKFGSQVNRKPFRGTLLAPMTMENMVGVKLGRATRVHFKYEAVVACARGLAVDILKPSGIKVVSSFQAGCRFLCDFEMPKFDVCLAVLNKVPIVKIDALEQIVFALEDGDLQLPEPAEVGKLFTGVKFSKSKLDELVVLGGGTLGRGLKLGVDFSEDEFYDSIMGGVWTGGTKVKRTTSGTRAKAKATTKTNAKETTKDKATTSGTKETTKDKAKETTKATTKATAKETTKTKAKETKDTTKATPKETTKDTNTKTPPPPSPPPPSPPPPSPPSPPPPPIEPPTEHTLETSSRKRKAFQKNKIKKRRVEFDEPKEEITEQIVDEEFGFAFE